MVPRILLSLLLLGVCCNLKAQDCFNFHKQNCCPKKGAFAYSVNEASVSFAFKPGESKCVYMDLLEGKDYRMTICSDSLYNGVVSFVIKNTDGRILYDNSQDDFLTDIEFSCRKHNSVELIITAPNRLDVDSETKGCIGVLIEDMVSPKIGF